jgi:hypothetical protein
VLLFWQQLQPAETQQFATTTNTIMRFYKAELEIRIRERFFPDPGSRIQHIVSDSLLTIFWVKIIKNAVLRILLKLQKRLKKNY